MFVREILLRPSAMEAFGMMLLLVGLLGVGMIGLGWVPHLVVMLGMMVLWLYGLVRGVAFGNMQKAMVASVGQGMGAVYLLFFIGPMVAALMMSGAVPTLMYYGFAWISPSYFYLVAFVLCAVIGVCIGSSLTTCAVVGVVFMGIARAFGADLAITAGAVVSGAFFGDKMSPLSDTTVIAAATVGVDLFEHIRNMAYTTLPAFLLTALAFTWFVPEIAVGSLEDLYVLRKELMNSGLVHNDALLIFVLLVGLALCRVNALLIMVMVILMSLGLTFVHIQTDLGQLGNWLFHGYRNEMIGGHISHLVTRGGMESMFFTQMMIVLALSFGGLLFALGIVPVLLEVMRNVLTSANRATICVAATSLGVNVLIGEQYLSILLAGETFKPVYKRLHLHRRNLSRTLEDAGTVINPLVPWSVCGVFIAKVLGVAVWDYLPYSFFCYLSLLLTLIVGFTGVTLSCGHNNQLEGSDNG